MNRFEGIALIAFGLLAVILRRSVIAQNERFWDREIPESSKRFGEILIIAIGLMLVVVGLLKLFS